jgi:hypothetical protein
MVPFGDCAMTLWHPHDAWVSVCSLEWHSSTFTQSSCINKATQLRWAGHVARILGMWTAFKRLKLEDQKRKGLFEDTDNPITTITIWQSGSCVQATSGFRGFLFHAACGLLQVWKVRLNYIDFLSRISRLCNIQWYDGREVMHFKIWEKWSLHTPKITWNDWG